MKVAIIGTAGRREDGKRLGKRVWDWMRRDVLSRLGDLEREFGRLKLVSGGSAWADHLAVWAFLLEESDFDLELALPAEIVKGRYFEGIGRIDPGRTANYYHEQFTGRIYRGWKYRERIAGETFERGPIRTIEEIEEAMRRERCTVTWWDGFKERNKRIAAVADVVIAYTFGRDQPKGGGTMHTWKRVRKGARKIHVSLEEVRV